jgi:hypothetical protein
MDLQILKLVLLSGSLPSLYVFDFGLFYRDILKRGGLIGALTLQFAAKSIETDNVL